MTNRYICKYAEKCEEKQNRNSELFVYYNLHMKNQMLDNATALLTIYFIYGQQGSENDFFE